MVRQKVIGKKAITQRQEISGVTEILSSQRIHLGATSQQRPVVLEKFLELGDSLRFQIIITSCIPFVSLWSDFCELLTEARQQS